MRIVPGCLVAAGLMIGSAYAQTYTALGAGSLSCGTWTANRLSAASDPARQDEQWIVRFLSGVGWVGNGRDPPNGVDAEAVWA